MVFTRQERYLDPKHTESSTLCLVPLEMGDEPVDIRRVGTEVVFEVLHVTGWIISCPLERYRQACKQHGCVCACGYCY